MWEMKIRPTTNKALIPNTQFRYYIFRTEIGYP